MSRRLRVGVLGAGMIATHPTGVLPNVEMIEDRVAMAAIASRTRRSADEVARRFGIPSVYDTLTEMLERAELDVVLNLTPGPAHSATNLEILNSGTHLITEKPIAGSLEDADAIIDVARERELLVVVAPPWMLDPRRILARRLARTGSIGKVAFARSRSSHAGPAAMSWPADPSWFYAAGSGSLLDMGVYGITEVTGILGPAKRVSAFSGVTAETRVARGGPFDGRVINVSADDNTLLLLDFGDSTFAVVDATYNVHAAVSPSLELFGLEGTLNLSEPFWATRGQAPLEVYRIDVVPGHGGWTAPELAGLRDAQERFEGLKRAILVSHFADCLDTGMKPVLSAEHARHTLEIMIAAQRSADSGRVVDLTTVFNFEGTALESM
jgi:predicted dehydrogenase